MVRLHFCNACEYIKGEGTLTILSQVKYFEADGVVAAEFDSGGIGVHGEHHLGIDVGAEALDVLLVFFERFDSLVDVVAYVHGVGGVGRSVLRTGL